MTGALKRGQRYDTTLAPLFLFMALTWAVQHDTLIERIQKGVTRMVRPQSEGRTRFAREGGWLGRRRHYKCRKCGNDFVHDGFTLPEKERICTPCRMPPDVREQYLAKNTEGSDSHGE